MFGKWIGKNRFPLGVAAVWLVTIWALVLAADVFFGQPLSLTAWAGNWDGGWYQSIVNSGYVAGVPTQQANLAFFPLYPLLVWFVSKITQLPVVWAGMAVSSVSFTVALVVLHKFVSQRWNAQTARWIIFLLAFNPFSFYFGMMYTESLFLLCAAGTLWYVHKKDWWLAALMTGLASGTRSVGVALAMYVLASWLWHIKMGWQVKGPPKKSFVVVPTKIFMGKLPDRTPSKPNALTLLKIMSIATLSFSGLILFSLYLWQHTGDPIAYRHAQEFWPGRGGASNIMAELAYLWEHKVINLEYALMLMWYGATLVAFGGVVLLLKMREYLLALYATIALSLPLVFGTATAMTRYMLIAVPIFIAYAAVLARRPRWVKIAVAMLCVVGLAIITFLIINPRAAFVG